MKLLVTGAWRQAKENLEELRKLNIEVWFLKNEKDPLPCESDEIDYVICNNLFLYHPIEEFKNLKYIQVISAGLDRLPLDYIKVHDIQLFNAKGVYSVPMAEFVLCSVLDIYKRKEFFWNSQKDRIWQKNYELEELSDKRVCIVGCGDIGRECARRFQAFGCQVIGINRTVYSNEYFKEIKPLEELNNELADADITVLSIALTDDTFHLINKDNLNNMKEGSVLVNVSRGKIINTDELIEAIKQKQLRVVLDVFEEEPLDEKSELWNIAAVTPHNSYIGENNQKRLKNVIFYNLNPIM